MFILQVGESVLLGLAGHDYTDENRKHNKSKHKPKHKTKEHKTKPTPKSDLTMAFEPCGEFCGAL